MVRLVQIQRGLNRRIAVVEEPRLRLIGNFDSVYSLCMAALKRGVAVTAFIHQNHGNETLEYDPIYRGESDWHLLVPLDHPDGSSRTLVSGTGLTHFGSAKNRQAMHAKVAADDEQNLTDSMKMFRLGVEGGRPELGKIGVSPEWFYKGNGAILRAHGEMLEVPPYAEDGGEEAEIAGLYVIGLNGLPYRVGMTIGNEFSDHAFEKRNYLNLAGSKVRTCSLGPELVINPDFDSIAGQASIERGGDVLWSKAIRTGQTEMCHNLRNIEHHQFKFETHRRPGDVHVHYFGAHSLSCGDGVKLADGDRMVISWEGFGRALRNPVRFAGPNAATISAIPMT
jgi:hypothetical protein